MAKGSPRPSRDEQRVIIRLHLFKVTALATRASPLIASPQELSSPDGQRSGPASIWSAGRAASRPDSLYKPARRRSSAVTCMAFGRQRSLRGASQTKGHPARGKVTKGGGSSIAPSGDSVSAVWASAWGDCGGARRSLRCSGLVYLRRSQTSAVSDAASSDCRRLACDIFEWRVGPLPTS